MKKLDIVQYRSSDIEKTKMVKFEESERDLLISILHKKGLNSKQSGLCAPPYDKYFSLTYRDERGVSHNSGRHINPDNVCYVRVNEGTSTYAKTVYFRSFDIVKTAEYFYVVALAQSSRYDNPKGAKHVVYECAADELKAVIDILFKDVESVTPIK